MTDTLYELEGTWDELAKHASELEGKRLRITVLPDVALPAGSIEDKILRRSARVPPSEWDRVPDDFLDNLDAYLYGALRA